MYKLYRIVSSYFILVTWDVMSHVREENNVWHEIQCYALYIIMLHMMVYARSMSLLCLTKSHVILELSIQGRGKFGVLGDPPFLE